jgi:glutathione peroxidase
MTVKGDAKSPLYQLLTGEGSPTPGEVKWNFEKFVVDGQGNVVARFPSRTKPSDPALIAAVEKALNREG